MAFNPNFNLMDLLKGMQNSPFPVKSPQFPVQSPNYMPPMAQSPTMPKSGGMGDYIKSLQAELDDMLPEPPPQNKWQRMLEGALTGAGLVGEGSTTTGGNIASVANALLGVKPAMDQRRMQKRMEPLTRLAPLMQLRQQMNAEQKGTLDLEKLRAEINSMPVDDMYKQALMEQAQASAMASRHQAGAPYSIPAQPTPYTTTGLDPVKMSGGGWGQPTFNQATNAYEVKPMPSGATPVEKTTGSDYTRYEQNAVDTYNQQLVDAGQSPMTPDQEKAYRAMTYRRISGVRAGLTQEQTGGLPQLDRAAMETELKPLETRLAELQKVDALDYRIEQAVKLGKPPKAKEAEKMRQDEMTAIQKTIAEIQKRYTGKEPTVAPAEATPAPKIMKFTTKSGQTIEIPIED